MPTLIRNRSNRWGTILHDCSIAIRKIYQSLLNRPRRILTSPVILIGLAIAAFPLSSCTYVGTPLLSRSHSITIGTLYAGSGQFSVSSLAELAGLKFWANETNKAGGVYVAALHKHLRVKIISYDDKSSAQLAGQLYRKLIEVNHVDFLVSDFGSVLTQPAVRLAERNQMLLFDQSGSGTSLFTSTNPYLVLCDLPTSTVWPLPLGRLLLNQHLRRIAIIYAKNEFDGAQDQTVAGLLTQHGISPIANIEVPTSERSYGKLISKIASLHPQALLEFGYQNNDIAFLNSLKNSQLKAQLVFTAFPGQLHQLLQDSVGTKGLSYTFSYAFPPRVKFENVNFGLNDYKFVSAFQQVTHQEVNFLNVAGYNTGIIFQAAAANAKTFTQLGLRAALNNLSGKLKTIEGTFEINSQGAQIGETLGISELFPATGGGTSIESVFPVTSSSVQIKLGLYGKTTN